MVIDSVIHTRLYNALLKYFETTIVLCFLTTLLSIEVSIADTIYLKDGTTQESDRIWESDKYVHFLLNGTTNIEIRYRKDIVERISSKGDSIEQISIGSKGRFTEKSESIKELETKPSVSPSNEIRSEQPIDRATEQFLSSIKGINFYDPRRKERYWAAPDAKFNDLKSALKALSTKYNRPTEWIAKHMGEENELKHIHSKLIYQLKSEDNVGQYETHKVEAAAAPKPIVNKIGIPSGDVANSFQPKQTEKKVILINGGEYRGINFYEPRREFKYWTSATTHHHSLKEALAALAHQYSVSSEWISQNMGQSNDLEKIHQSILTKISSNTDNR
jgi:hypothetical protein